jgi:hypothetical protein
MRRLRILGSRHASVNDVAGEDIRPGAADLLE